MSKNNKNHMTGIKVLMVKENRKSFTIKEESLKIPTLITTLRVPKEQLSEEDLLTLRELVANPAKRESIKESFLKRRRIGLPLFDLEGGGFEGEEIEITEEPLLTRKEAECFWPDGGMLMIWENPNPMALIPINKHFINTIGEKTFVVLSLLPVDEATHKKLKDLWDKDEGDPTGLELCKFVNRIVTGNETKCTGATPKKEYWPKRPKEEV